MNTILTWNNNNVDEQILRTIGYPGSPYLVKARVVVFEENLTEETRQQLESLGVYLNESPQKRLSYYAGYRAGLTYERLKELLKLTAPISVPANSNESWSGYGTPSEGKLIARIMRDLQRRFPAGSEPYNEAVVQKLTRDVVDRELISWVHCAINTNARGKSELSITVSTTPANMIDDKARFKRVYSKLVLSFAKKALQNLTPEIVEKQLQRVMGHEFTDEALLLVSEKLKTIRKISYAGVETRTSGPNLP